MDAVEFLKKQVRMCKYYNGCDGCPIQKECLDTDPEEMVDAVEQWSQFHPQKTIIQDFFEKFPNAPRTVDGLPFPCPFECGYSKNNNCPFGKNNPSDDCSKCWFRPLED